MPKEELQKYGAPLYGVAWAGDHAYMCGGGNLGIENKIVVVASENGKLTEEVVKLNVGSDAPYRMAMHPSGTSMALGLTLGGLVRVEISPPSSSNKKQPPVLTLMPNDDGADTKRFQPIKSMSFTEDGRTLAVGGEDGSLELVSWPSLERIRQWQASENNKAIRNCDFSTAHGDGILFTVDESGACKLWDVATGDLITQLKVPGDMPRAGFFRCKSVVDEEGIALYTAAKFKGNGYIMRWRQDEQGTVSLEARTPKPITPAPICGFEASHSGRLLAAVTPDGDQCVISAATLKPVKYRKNAHMTFATAVAFSPDDSMVLSTSADASATLTNLGKAGGEYSSHIRAVLTFLFALLAVLFGVLRYVVQQEPGIVQQQLQWLPVAIKEILLS